MENKTRIIVLRTKEIIYTSIFVILGIILLLLLIFMFSAGSKNKANNKSSDKYVAGVYSSTVNLGSSTLNVEVTVDKDTVQSVQLVNLDESITTMYPLLEPSLEEINRQISTVDSIDDITYSQNNQYTTILLNQAIKNAIEKAKK